MWLAGTHLGCVKKFRGDMTDGERVASRGQRAHPVAMQGDVERAGPPILNGARTPAAACVAPMPAGRSSMISTAAPRRANSYATAQPTMPAPTTTMSLGDA